MNPTSKKLISLLLAFSLVMLSVNLYAKERRGAKLIVTKLDGQLIEGELITVKPKSLLLLDTEGKDVSIDIADIKVVKVVKKSKAWKYGLVAAGGVGLIGGILIPEEEHSFFATFMESFIWIGLPVVGIVAIIEGKDKTIQIEGMTDLEISEALEKLRKKARIRDYK